MRPEVGAVAYFNAPEGARLRVRRLQTIERIRRMRAHNITLCLERKFYEQNAKLINDIIGRNLLSVEEIKANLQRAHVPAKNFFPGLPQPSMEHFERNQGRFDQSEDEVLVDEGCSLSLLIDNTKINLQNHNFRVLPSDDLVESIRDLAGPDSVQILYH